MKTPKMTFSAAGDMLIQRLISTEYDGFQQIRDHISKADARFFNFESIIYREGLWETSSMAVPIITLIPARWKLPRHTAST